MDSGIREYYDCGIRNSDQSGSLTNKESGDQELIAWNPESKTVLDHFTWGNFVNIPWFLSHRMSSWLVYTWRLVLLSKQYNTKNPGGRAQGSQTIGGDLPIIKSAAENKFVFELMRNSDTVTAIGAWLGLERDKVSRTKFRWIDGTPLEGEYENWFDGQPDNHNGKEECVNMFMVNNTKAAGRWNDYACGCYNDLPIYCPVILCQRPIS